jgi:hypothetical protein
MKGGCGFWLCSHCYERGKVIGTKVYYTDGKAGYRTEESWIIDQYIASKYVDGEYTSFRESKGYNEFSKYEGSVKSPILFPLYVMHTFDCNVVQRTLFIHWIQANDISKENLQIIDKIVENSKTPFHFCKGLISPSKYEKFKSCDWTTFSQYLGLPILKGILTDVKYEHYKLYVMGMKIFKVKRLHKGVSYLGDYHHEKFYEFLSNAIITNGDQMMFTLKTHQASKHTGEIARDLGDLYEGSSLQWEAINGIPVKSVHGSFNLVENVLVTFDRYRLRYMLSKSIRDANNNKI